MCGCLEVETVYEPKQDEKCSLAIGPGRVGEGGKEGSEGGWQ